MKTAIPKLSVDLSLGMKGLAQFRVVRAMLKLGAFTRKELALHSGEDMDSVYAIVLRHKDWFYEKEIVRTGNPGPPETRFILSPEKQRELAIALDPLYEAVTAAAPREPLPASAYVPTAIEFQAATDLVSSLSEGGTEEVEPGEIRSVVRLLEIASGKEGLPVERSFEAYLKQDATPWSETQKMAKAHFDGLRAKLCLLSIPGFLGREPGDAFGFHEPIQLGLGFLESAALLFTASGAGKQVRELDLWAEQHASPIMVRLLANPASGKKNWQEQLLRAVESPRLAMLAPRFVAPLAPRRFEIVDPARVARAQNKVLCTIVEVNPFGEVRSATQKLIRQPSRGAFPVVADSSRILDGLVSIYRANYRPPAGQVVALVNVRHEQAQVAILKGSSLVFSKIISPPSRHEKILGSRAHYPNRMPIFAAGGKGAAREKEFLMTELKNTFEFYRNSSNGEQVSTVYVTGEQKLSEAVENALRARLRLSSQSLDLAKSMNVQAMGYSKAKGLERARRMAPELGIALQESSTLNRRKLLEQNLVVDVPGLYEF